jgi:polyisoprenoid-binding protein YceI
MNKIAKIVLVAMTVLLFSFETTENSTWLLDKSRTNLGFTISGFIISDILVQFKNFDGKFTSSREDFSDAEAEIITDVNSIRTADGERDDEMKGPDFFDVANYPDIKFKSRSFKKMDDKNYKITGDMTMHGVTKRIQLNAICKVITNPKSKKTVAGFKITGTIKRADFNMNSSSISSTLVDNKISMFANLEFIKN